MKVSFNPSSTNNKSNRQSPSFKSLENGIIEATEVAKHTYNTHQLASFIYVGAYKPTVENLKALFDAKEIANKNVNKHIGTLLDLDDSIAMLIKKAKERGGQTYDSLKELVKKANDQGIDLNV